MYIYYIVLYRCLLQATYVFITMPHICLYYFCIILPCICSYCLVYEFVTVLCRNNYYIIMYVFIILYCAWYYSTYEHSYSIFLFFLFFLFLFFYMPYPFRAQAIIALYNFIYLVDLSSFSSFTEAPDSHFFLSFTFFLN